ncbi:MAG: 50S ribosomal protein L6 [Candidatus Aenigmarchaeota archaeon]|nr:50S ribosomal protein L6 [Candidatus Aenigmarchaeota archaeon]
MEKLVSVPEGVQVEIDSFKVSVSAEKGKLERDFMDPLFKRYLKIEKIDDKVKVFSISDKRKQKAIVGTVAAHIRNMIEGVLNGYEKKLKIAYIHFPFTVKVEGNVVNITNFLGEKSPRFAKIIGDAKVEVKGDQITVAGINKEEVGQTAGNIELATKVKRYDRRIFQDGVFLLK